MNEHEDVICQVRESFSGLSMDMPVEQVFARSHIRRRRQLAGLTAGVAATTAGAAAAVTLTLGGPAPARSGNPPPASHGLGSQAGVKLAAFSVTSGPGGRTTLTVHKGRKYQRLDPAAVRQALARHGIPALVTVGKFCRPSNGVSPGQTSKLLSPAGSGMVINGRAMPPGTKLSIGLFPHDTRMLIVKDGSRLSCSSTSHQPAVHVLRPSGTPIRR